MNYWDPNYEPAQEPYLEIAELAEDDVKVALANFIRLSSNFDNDQVQLISYEAKNADVRNNYSRVYQLKVNFQIRNENHNVKLILKLQNHDLFKQDKELMSKRQLFIKEILFYGCIVPKMKELMPTNQNEIPVPECYLAKSNESSLYQASQASPCCFLPGSVDVLIIEDVMKGRFYRESNGYFNISQLKLAIKSVAQIHALSAVLNRRGSSHNLSLTQTFPALSEETLYNKHANKSWYEQYSSAIEIFSVIGPMMNEETLLPGRDLSKVVPVMMRELWDMLEDCLKPSFSQINTLCLNSCDIKSFAFSYDDDNKNPRDCKIINYQNVKYSRPITDVVQLIYNCTQFDLENDKLNHIIELYHDTFLNTINKCIQKYHSTLPLPNGLLSISELKDSYRECRLLGATRRAIIASYACLLNFDPYTFDGSDLCCATEELLTRHERLPPRAEIKERAARAFRENPHYRVLMYRTMSELLERLAERINCLRGDPHRECPHPNPQ